MAVAGLAFTSAAYGAYAWTALVRLGGLDDALRFGVGVAILALLWLAAHRKPQTITLWLLVCLPLFGNHPGGRYMEFINLPLAASAGGLIAKAKRDRRTAPAGAIWAFAQVTVVTALVAFIPTLPRLTVRAAQINDPLLFVAAALTAAEDDLLYSVSSLVLLMLAVVWAYALCWSRAATELSRSIYRLLTSVLFTTAMVGVLDYAGLTSLGPAYLRALDPRAVHLVGLQSIFWHPAWFAWYFVITFAIALGWCASVRGPTQWLLYCGLALSYGCFFLNTQRGGLVTIHVVLFLFAWHRLRGTAPTRSSRWVIAALVPLLILAVVALSVPAWREALTRANLISVERTLNSAAEIFGSSGEVPRPASERSRLWRAAALMWLSAPVFGIGEGSFAWRFHDFAPVGSSLDTPSYGDAHNQFLQVLATRGAVGAAVYLGLLIVVARALLHRWRDPLAAPDVTGLILALAAFVTYSFVSALFYLQSVQVLFWLVVALAANLAPQAPAPRRTRSIIAVGGLTCAAVQWSMTQPLFADASILRALEPRGFYPVEYTPQGAPMRWSSALGVLCLAPWTERVQLRFAVVDPRVAELPRIVTLQMNGVDLDRFAISTTDVATRTVVLANPLVAGHTGTRFDDCAPQSRRLHVSVDRTWSPADTGFGSDPRRLGVLVFEPTYLPVH